MLTFKETLNPAINQYQQIVQSKVEELKKCESAINAILEEAKKLKLTSRITSIANAKSYSEKLHRAIQIAKTKYNFEIEQYFNRYIFNPITRRNDSFPLSIEEAKGKIDALIERLEEHVEAVKKEIGLKNKANKIASKAKADIANSPIKKVVEPLKQRYSSRKNEPYYVDMDSNKIKQFIRRAKEKASNDYDNFIVKLVTKIGPVKSASIVGNHVWDFSELTVVTKLGETQVWRTKMKHNQSKYALPFLQFPSIKLK